MCQVMQEIGFGITREMVGNVVMDYQTKAGRILLQMTGQVVVGVHAKMAIDAWIMVRTQVSGD